VKWKTKKLGDICLLVRGPFGGSLKKTSFVESGFAVYEQNHAIKDQCKDFRYFISQQKFNEMSRFEVAPGDILMSCSGTIGKSTIVPNEAPKGIINQALLKITPSKDIDVKFLKLYMESELFAKQLMETVDGAAIQNVASVKTLKNIEINLPALEEQHRIVAKLDVAFAKIDKAIKTENFKLENSNKLSASVIEEIFRLESNDWKTVSLGEVIKVERGSSPRPIKKYLTDDNGVNWVKISDTEQNGKYVTKTKEKITLEGSRKSRHVRKGDLILTNSMSFGRPYIMEIEGFIHDGWFVLRLGNQLNIDYIYYLLASPFVQKQFQKLAAGSVVKNISSDLTKKALLPIPSLERQKEVAKLISQLEEATATLSLILNSKIKNYSALKSAILIKELQREVA